MTTTDTAQSGTQASKTVKQCGCLTGTGQTCDRTTQKAFAQGHDARMASRLAQAVADPQSELTADQAEALIREAGGSDLLVGKMRHSAELRRDSASRPRTPKTPKEKAPKPEADDSAEARAVASAGNGLLGTRTQVTHKDKTYDAVVVKDAAGTTVARHRLIGQNCDHEVSDDGTTGAKIR